jgi:hypothetical protein
MRKIEPKVGELRRFNGATKSILYLILEIDRISSVFVGGDVYVYIPKKNAMSKVSLWEYQAVARDEIVFAQW